jgi:uncharacterized protein (DUF2236 family)
MLAAGEIRVTPAAREIARTVLYPVRWMPRGAWDLAHLVSIATLPAPLRRQYGIGWSAARERGIERLAAVSRRALPLVPAPLRFAPQALRAERRVRQAMGASTR